ncbi:MAG: phosphate ABC transporter permease PstA [Clostridia bacterium]|nr:phosphate ABC transporter permease PstA [Clostridia bacterium]
MAAQKTESKFNKENTARIIFFVLALFSVIVVIAIIGYVLYGSIPAFNQIGFFKFLFGTEWLASASSYGVGILIVGTLALTFTSLAVGGFIGVVVAVWIVYYCPERVNPDRVKSENKFVRKCVKVLSRINFKSVFSFLINILAGIPSIVFGLFAYEVVMPSLVTVFNQSGTGTGLLPAAIILSIMILPTITSLFRNSLQSLPDEYYEGAIALGATKHQAVWRTMFPAAKKGLVSALILGCGRAIGETMAVQMIVGNGSGYPGWFNSFGTLTSNIVKNWGYGSADTLHRSALIADAFVLLVLVLILNVVLLATQREKGAGGRPLGGVFYRRRKDRDRVPDTGQAGEIAVEDAVVLPAAPVLEAVAVESLYLPHEPAAVGAEMCVAEDTDEDAAGSESGVAERAYDKKGGPTKGWCVVSWIFAAIVAFILVYIVVWVLVKGLPNISVQFLFGSYSYKSPSISAAIVSTLMLILLALVIAVPLGIAAAIYFVEYSKKGSKIVKTIRVFIDTLAGIPSIIFGIFGYIFLVDVCGLGYSLWAGGITLAFMVLPTIIRSTEQALLDVPDSVREASYALGAGKVRTVFRVVLPQAMTGIITAIILSIGRILSESAALIFTAGSSGNVMPSGYGSQCASLSVMIYLFMSEGRYFNEAYATAAVVLILVVILNIIIAIIEHFAKKRRKA